MDGASQSVHTPVGTAWPKPIPDRVARPEGPQGVGAVASRRIRAAHSGPRARNRIAL